MNIILTNAGASKVAAGNLTITTFAVGDGNGSAVTPAATDTAMVHSVYSSEVSGISIVGAQVLVSCGIPAASGPYVIREIGLFAGSDLVAHGSIDNLQKNNQTGTLINDLILKIYLTVSSTSAVSTTVSGSALATKEDLDTKPDASSVYTKTEADSLLDEKSATGHKHTKSDITDFPMSMPASDVSAWAKAATKPTYTKTEVGLGNVDNTTDAGKPVSTAQAAALALKQDTHVIVSASISTTWSGTDIPFAQSITLTGVSGMTDSTGVQLTLSATATAAQVEAWNDIGLQGGAVSGSTITLRCFGTKNEVAVPISVMVWK